MGGQPGKVGRKEGMPDLRQGGEQRRGGTYCPQPGSPQRRGCPGRAPPSRREGSLMSGSALSSPFRVIKQLEGL